MSRFFLIIALLWLASCASGDEDNGRQGQRGGYTPTVEVVQTVTGALPLEERLTGTVRARNQTDITPEISGQVTEVLVRSGQRVTAGQPLVKLRDNEVRERVRQAESGLEIARAQVRQAEVNLEREQSRLNRVETLMVRNLESELELETIRAEVASAEASLQLSKAQKSQAESVLEERKNDLEHTIIKAPISGFVGTRQVEVGQAVNTSSVLFQIGDTEMMEIRISLNERMLSYIREGQSVNISSPVLGENVIQTQLTRISPFLNPVTNATIAEIEVENTDGILKSGMFVTIDILYGESEQAVLIPNNALYTHPQDGRRGVYVTADFETEIEFEDEPGADRPPVQGPVPVEFVPVNIVAQGRLISGVSGIQSGDYVVTVGHNLIASGRNEARVRVMSWDRILELQQMQSRDLLDMIREKMARRNGQDSSET